jgi:hypothetical protein
LATGVAAAGRGEVLKQRRPTAIVTQAPPANGARKTDLKLAAFRLIGVLSSKRI